MKFDSRCESISQVFADGENLTSVTLDAGDGIIPATVGWQVEQDGTATKSYAQNSTYGTLPIPQRAGYAFDGWSLLPDEYQQVEYIESTGTQYIDTNYYPTPNTGIDTTFALTSLEAQQRIFGNSSHDNSNTFGIDVYVRSYGDFGYAYNNGIGNWVGTGVTANTQKHDLQFNINHRIVFDDEFSIGVMGNATQNSNHSLYIMAEHGAWNGEVQYKARHFSRVKFYKFIIYEDTLPVCNFIPCYKLEDNTIGFYETITNTFLTNQGSGTFLKGDDVDVLVSDDQELFGTDHTLYARWSQIPEVGVFVDVVMPSVFVLIAGLVTLFYVKNCRSKNLLSITKR